MNIREVIRDCDNDPKKLERLIHEIHREKQETIKTSYLKEEDNRALRQEKDKLIKTVFQLEQEKEKLKRNGKPQVGKSKRSNSRNKRLYQYLLKKYRDGKGKGNDAMACLLALTEKQWQRLWRVGAKNDDSYRDYVKTSTVVLRAVFATQNTFHACPISDKWIDQIIAGLKTVPRCERAKRLADFTPAYVDEYNTVNFSGANMKGETR